MMMKDEILMIIDEGLDRIGKYPQDYKIWHGRNFYASNLFFKSGLRIEQLKEWFDQFKNYEFKEESGYLNIYPKPNYLLKRLRMGL